MPNENLVMTAPVLLSHRPLIPPELSVVPWKETPFCRHPGLPPPPPILSTGSMPSALAAQVVVKISAAAANAIFKASNVHPALNLSQICSQAKTSTCKGVGRLDVQFTIAFVQVTALESA